MIRQSVSLARSTAVVALLQTVNVVLDGTIEAYQNGREQGYAIVVDYDNCFYICEHRNTDMICVYRGKMAMQGLSSDAYGNSKMFASSVDAATFIIEEMCKLQGLVWLNRPF